MSEIVTPEGIPVVSASEADDVDRRAALGQTVVIREVDMADPLKREMIMRDLRQKNMAAAKQLGRAFNAVASGRAGLTPKRDSDGAREVLLDGEHTGHRINAELVAKLWPGKVDYTPKDDGLI